MTQGWAGGGDLIGLRSLAWDLGVSKPAWGTSQSEGGDRSETVASPTPLLCSYSGVSPVAQLGPCGPGSPSQGWHLPWESTLPHPTPAISSSVHQVGRGVELRSECRGALQISPSPVYHFPPEPYHLPVKL